MPEALPDDVEALKAALLAMRVRADLAEAEFAVARDKLDIVQAEAAEAKAQVSDSQALIAHLKLQIAKLRRERFAKQITTTIVRIDPPPQLPGVVASGGGRMST